MVYAIIVTDIKLCHVMQRNYHEYVLLCALLHFYEIEKQGREKNREKINARNISISIEIEKKEDVLNHSISNRQRITVKK